MNARFRVGVVLLFSLGALAVPAQGEGAAPETRTWTDSTGTHTVEAQLVDVKDGKVHLKKIDGTVAVVPLEKLSEADQRFVRSQGGGANAGNAPATAMLADLAGKPRELAQDDGKIANKKSIAGGGHAVRFETGGGTWYLTSVSLHGSRYGYPTAPKEDFHVWLCDEQFKVITDFSMPYSRFQRGDPRWVPLKVKPTLVPEKFIVCFGFNPTATKGVFVSYDGQASGNSLVGVPGRKAGPFESGDWMIRATLDQLKTGGAKK